MFIFPEIGRMVIVGLMILIPICLIYKKAGYHPVWGLLVFLPGLGLLLIFLQLAFSPWPNLKKREQA